MERNLLGRGWAFPLSPAAGGGIALSPGQRSVEEAIRIILGTTPGERLMRPDFGCRLSELVFAPASPRSISLAQQYVREALQRWEPRIIVQEVRGEADTGSPEVVKLHIHYEIRSVNTFFNMVYPFYLERGESDSKRQLG